MDILFKSIGHLPTEEENQLVQKKQDHPLKKLLLLILLAVCGNNLSELGGERLGNLKCFSMG